jgi:3-hydroxybutyryl-CoA dehydrogenase
VIVEASGTARGIEAVAIIGAGRLGRSFAKRCVDAGFRVILEDVMPANLRRAQEDFSEHWGTSLTCASTVEDAVREADLAIDFVPDELESKLEIFSMIDRMAPPKTILCTPSDAQSITDLASCTYRPDRCVAVRTDGVDLAAAERVRLLYGVETSAETVQVMERFWARLGKQVLAESDPNPPMLVKNLIASAKES